MTRAICAILLLLLVPASWMRVAGDETDRLVEKLADDKTTFYAAWRLIGSSAAGRQKLSTWLQTLSPEKPQDKRRIGLVLMLLCYDRPAGSEQLIQPYLTSKDREVRLAAATALACRDDQRGVKILIQALETEAKLGGSKWQIIGQKILLASTVKFIAPLIELLDAEHRTAYAARKLLGRLTDQKIRDSEKNEKQQWNNWWAKNEKTFDLRKAMIDDTRGLAHASQRIQFLAAIPDPRATPKLLSEVRQLREPNRSMLLLQLLVRPLVRKSSAVMVWFYEGLSAQNETTRAISQKGLLLLAGVDHGRDLAAWKKWWGEINRAGRKAGPGGRTIATALEVRLLLSRFSHRQEDISEKAGRYFLNHPEETIPGLLEIVEDSAGTRDSTRRLALDLLVKLEAVEGGDRLLKLLERIMMGQQQAETRFIKRLVAAMGELEIQQSVGLLRRLMNRKGLPTLENNFSLALNLRDDPLWALCLLRDKAATEIVRKRMIASPKTLTLKHGSLPGHLSREAFRSGMGQLELLGKQTELEFVYRAAGDPQQPNHAGAMGFVGHLQTERARKLLLAGMKHPSTVVRLIAVEHLMNRGFKPSVEFSKRLYQDCWQEWEKKGTSSGLMRLGGGGTVTGRGIVERMIEAAGRRVVPLILASLKTKAAQVRASKGRAVYAHIGRLHALVETLIKIADSRDKQIFEQVRQAGESDKTHNEDEMLRLLARLAAKLDSRQATSFLLTCLDHQDGMVKIAASRALALLKHPKGPETLLKMLDPKARTQYAGEKSFVARALIEIGNPAGARWLKQALARPNDSAIWQTVKLAADMAPPEIFDEISRWSLGELESYGDRQRGGRWPVRQRHSWSKRERCVDALARYPWKRTRPVYKKLLEQGYFSYSFYEAIAKHPEPEFLPLLVKNAMKEILEPGNPLLDALAAHGARAAAAFTARMRHKDATVRSDALLVALKFPRWKIPDEILQHALTGERDLVIACRLAARQKYHPGKKILLRLFSHRRLGVRVTAIRLAGSVATAALAPRLEQLLKDRRPSARSAAARALEQIKKRG